MSGRVPPSSRARARATGSGDTQRAAARFKRFTGHDVEIAERFKIPPLPKTVACMGECIGLIYQTRRDDRVEKYIHRFAHADAPLVCVSPDGKQILLIGGNFTWTERGIVDKSYKD